MSTIVRRELERSWAASVPLTLLTLLLLDVAESLLARQVGYAVVGALAASVHGAVRASMDADVLLSVGVQESKSLESAFKAAGFRTEASRGDVDDPIPGMLKG